MCVQTHAQLVIHELSLRAPVSGASHLLLPSPRKSRSLVALAITTRSLLCPLPASVVKKNCGGHGSNREQHSKCWGRAGLTLVSALPMMKNPVHHHAHCLSRMLLWNQRRHVSGRAARCRSSLRVVSEDCSWTQHRR